MRRGGLPRADPGAFTLAIWAGLTFFRTIGREYGTMLPLPASGACFRQGPEVGCPRLSQREAILLLPVGLLWRDHARLPEDDPVRVALELLAEEDRVEQK